MPLFCTQPRRRVDALRMKKRTLMIVLATFVVTAIVGVLRLTGFSGAARGEQVTYEVLARRFHLGDGPCLRYLESGAVPEEESRAMADRLFDRGFSSQEFSDAIDVTFSWAKEREDARHAQSEVDELVAGAKENLSPAARLALFIKGDEELRKPFEFLVGADRVKADGLDAYERLPPERKALLRQQWERRPDLFIVSSIIPMLTRMRVRTTEQRLDELVTAVRRHIQLHGEPPRNLSALDRVPETSLLDGWANAFEYEPLAGGVRLISFGSDHSRDDRDAGNDLERVVLLDPNAVAPGRAAPESPVE